MDLSDTDDDAIWVSEVWASEHDHEASSTRPETPAAIGTAMPLLTGQVPRPEVIVAGDLGV